VSGRNANGEGTIYRRKDGRYEAATYAITTTSLRKRIRVYGRTKSEVVDKLLDVKIQAKSGIPIPEQSWTISAYAAYWLETVIKPNLRSSAYERYETAARLYLRPDSEDISYPS
jgi:hypothetical protein